jgi:uncharacterized SAM-binding protein YcdF (DUF218 family)
MEPLLTLLFLLAGIGLARLRGGKGHRALLISVLGLLLLSLPTVDWVFSRYLEIWYPVRQFTAKPVEAIVVLSSAIDPPHSEHPYPLVGQETFERCQYAAWIRQLQPNAPVLACGGKETEGSLPDSIVMRQLLERAGVPDSYIWTEEKSHSTYENALYGAAILKLHGIHTIALVVEARSMLRASACFRKQGITVLPAPCSFRQFGPFSEELIPSWKGIQGNEATLHETVGYVWYWLRGWV